MGPLHNQLEPQPAITGAIDRLLGDEPIRDRLTAISRRLNDRGITGPRLTDEVSAAMVELYGEVYDHERTTATTYINDKVVVCILRDILSEGETVPIAKGESDHVIDTRVAFQRDPEDQLTEAVERLTGCSVKAFLSANQTDHWGFCISSARGCGSSRNIG